MKQFFTGRLFKDEVSLWEYIQTFNQAPQDMSDGTHVIEVDNEHGQIIFHQAFHMANDEQASNFLRSRAYHYERIVFEIKNKVLITRFFEGHEISAVDQFINSQWVNQQFTHHSEVLKRREVAFTAEECQLAAQKLINLLRVDGKKTG